MFFQYNDSLNHKESDSALQIVKSIILHGEALYHHPLSQIHSHSRSQSKIERTHSRNNIIEKRQGEDHKETMPIVPECQPQPASLLHVHSPRSGSVQRGREGSIDRRPMLTISSSPRAPSPAARSFSATRPRPIVTSERCESTGRRRPMEGGRPASPSARDMLRTLTGLREKRNSAPSPSARSKQRASSLGRAASQGRTISRQRSASPMNRDFSKTSPLYRSFSPSRATSFDEAESKQTAYKPFPVSFAPKKLPSRVARSSYKKKTNIPSPVGNGVVEGTTVDIMKQFHGLAKVENEQDNHVKKVGDGQRPTLTKSGSWSMPRELKKAVTKKIIPVSPQGPAAAKKKFLLAFRSPSPSSFEQIESHANEAAKEPSTSKQEEEGKAETQTQGQLYHQILPELKDKKAKEVQDTESALVADSKLESESTEATLEARNSNHDNVQEEQTEAMKEVLCSQLTEEVHSKATDESTVDEPEPDMDVVLAVEEENEKLENGEESMSISTTQEKNEDPSPSITETKRGGTDSFELPQEETRSKAPKKRVTFQIDLDTNDLVDDVLNTEEGTEEEQDQNIRLAEEGNGESTASTKSDILKEDAIEIASPTEMAEDKAADSESPFEEEQTMSSTVPPVEEKMVIFDASEGNEPCLAMNVDEAMPAAMDEDEETPKLVSDLDKKDDGNLDDSSQLHQSKEKPESTNNDVVTTTDEEIGTEKESNSQKDPEKNEVEEDTTKESETFSDQQAVECFEEVPIVCEEEIIDTKDAKECAQNKLSEEKEVPESVNDEKREDQDLKVIELSDDTEEKNEESVKDAESDDLSCDSKMASPGESSAYNENELIEKMSNESTTNADDENEQHTDKGVDIDEEDESDVVDHITQDDLDLKSSSEETKEYNQSTSTMEPSPSMFNEEISLRESTLTMENFKLVISQQAAKTKISFLEEEVSEAKEHLAIEQEKTKEIIQRESQLAVRNSQLINKNEENQRIISDLENKVGEVKGMLVVEKERNEELSFEKQELAEKHEKLEKENDQSNKLVNSLKTKISRIKEELSLEQEKNRVTHAALESMQGKVGEMRKKHQDCLGKMSALRDELTQSQEETLFLKEKDTVFVEKLKQAAAQQDKLKAQIDVLKLEKSNASHNAREAEREIALLKETIKSIQSESDQNEKNMIEQKGVIQSLQTQLEEIQKVVTALQESAKKETEVSTAKFTAYRRKASRIGWGLFLCIFIPFSRLIAVLLEAFPIIGEKLSSLPFAELLMKINGIDVALEEDIVSEIPPVPQHQATSSFFSFSTPEILTLQPSPSSYFSSSTLPEDEPEITLMDRVAGTTQLLVHTVIFCCAAFVFLLLIFPKNQKKETKGDVKETAEEQKMED